MPNLFCVRADFGKYTQHFIKGGYIGIGWIENRALSEVKNKDDIQNLYVENYPNDVSPYKIGQQVGQIARFLFEIKANDYVITPARETNNIYWGIVLEEPYYYSDMNDGCPFIHRRKVKWNKEPVQRKQFSVPFQNSIRSSLTVFSIKHKNDFFKIIGKKDFAEEIKVKESTEEIVLRKILELDAGEFELLVTNILTALGFEAERTGKVGDKGIDVEGELDLHGLAKIKLIVQAKRYTLGARVSERDVRALRQNIPTDAQGAFITTAKFDKKALEAAVEPGFPYIGTINGSQLVDILYETLDELELDDEIKQKLGLKKGLVLE